MSNLNENDIAEMNENRNLTLLKRMLNEEYDEVMFWVECPAYQDEIIGIKDEDTYDSNDRLIKNITFQFEGMGEDNIFHNLMEWKNLIEELSLKEETLFKMKDEYQVKSDIIIEETDFKAIYGKNNAEVRKNHIKNELSDLYDNIHDIEFSIAYIGRRISFLKELIRTKRTLMGVKK